MIDTMFWLTSRRCLRNTWQVINLMNTFVQVEHDFEGLRREAKQLCLLIFCDLKWRCLPPWRFGSG